MDISSKIGGVLFAIIFIVVGAYKGASHFDLFVLGGIGGGVGYLVGGFVGVFVGPLVEAVTDATRDSIRGKKTDGCMECKHYVGPYECKVLPDIPFELWCKRGKPCEGNQFIQVEWSKPMRKSEIMSTLDMNSHEEFQQFTKLHRAVMLEQDDLILFKVQLDNMDKNTRSKFEKV